MDHTGLDMTDAVVDCIEVLLAVGGVLGAWYLGTFKLSGDIVDVGRERIKGILVEVGLRDC